MPFLELGDFRVHYALSGAPQAPLVVLSNSLGTTFSMWDPQLPALEKEFRVLRYDTRGHGQTSAPRGPYAIAQLGQDVVRMLEALQLDRAHFCGLSMGGMIGMWLGLHGGERLGNLVLCSTAARIGTAEGWNQRIASVLYAGMKPVAPSIVARWFTPEFAAGSPETVAWAQRMVESSSAEGYAACCAAIRDADFRESISAIRNPSLVIQGTKDPAVPLSDGRLMADHIPGAHVAELEAAHLSNVESPAQFTSALIRFLTS